MRNKGRVLADLQWGINWMKWSVLLYSVYASILYAMGLRSSGMTLLDVIGCYLVIGLLCAMVLGLSRPLIAKRRGAILVGAYTAVLVYMPLALLRTRDWTDKLPGVIFATVIASLAGAYTGNRLWSRNHLRK